MTGLEIAAALVTVASGAVSAIGAMQAGQAKSAAAKYEAQVADRNSKIARQQADADAADQRRENQRQLGAMRAAYGGAGVELAGSPLDVLADTAAEQELDVERINYRGTLKVIQETDKKNLAMAEASAAKKEGQLGAIGAVLKTGSSLFGLPSVKTRLNPT